MDRSRFPTPRYEGSIPFGAASLGSLKDRQRISNPSYIGSTPIQGAKKIRADSLAAKTEAL